MVISAPNDQERLTLRQEVQQLITDLQPTHSSPLNLSIYPGSPSPSPCLYSSPFWSSPVVPS
ncbi:MAG: hypothetical protein HC922_06855 [Leptolyngbyaceae cyanobacterium SM2_3_12]|nr:hypothetical protein [Leptolyngbyaceae cyanobacterium SM2_3_12]